MKYINDKTEIFSNNQLNVIKYCSDDHVVCIK